MEMKKSQSDVSLQVTLNPVYNKDLSGKPSPLTHQISLEKKLTKILSNQELCLLFRDWLKQQKCEENLHFWVDVELLKQHDEIPFTTKLDELYEKYFSTDAKFPLNIDDDLKRELDSRMEHLRQKRKSENSDLHNEIHEFGIMVVVDEILRSVLGLLENGCTARFLSSDQYKQWKETEGTHSNKGSLRSLKKWAVGSLRRQRALSNSSERLRFDKLWKFKEMETHAPTTSSTNLSKAKTKELFVSEDV